MQTGGSQSKFGEKQKCGEYPSLFSINYSINSVTTGCAVARACSEDPGE